MPGQKNLLKKVAGYARRTKELTSSGLKTIWSAQGAASAAFLAAIVAVTHTFIDTRGKLVVLSFDVHAEQSLPSDFGSALAAAVAARLNDYRGLFPPPDPTTGVRADQNENSFNIIQSFLTDLPLVSIPKLSPLNKGSTAIESIKIGPVSIPIRQIVFDNFPLFHRDTLRGTIDAFGDRITARLVLGPDDTHVTVVVTKNEGYQHLIDRISVQLLEQKKWITPIPMTPEALSLFAEGLQAYKVYAKFGEESWLAKARDLYGRALTADRNAELVRLHLAVTQYSSPQDKLLREAVDNFSILRGSAGEQFRRFADIGHVGAQLRLIDYSAGCNRKYQLLEAVVREVEGWGAEDFEETIAGADANRTAATYLLPNNPCSAVLSKLFGNLTFTELAQRAGEKYKKAGELLQASRRLDVDQKRRFRMAISLEKKYLLHALSDYAVLSNKDGQIENAKAALDAGLKLAKEKEALDPTKKRFFAQYLSGSNAESYLRVAALLKDEAEQKKLVIEAIALLRKTISEGDERAALWAMLRLADLELARDNNKDAIDWIIAYFNHVSGADTPILSLIDDRAFAAGGLIERPQARCRAIAVFEKANLPYSIFGRLLNADVRRRHGDLEGAADSLAGMETISTYVTQWIGKSIPARVELVRAKLAAAGGGKEKDRANALLAAIKSNPQIPPASMSLDLFELGQLTNEKDLLTQLKAAITFDPQLMSEALGTGQKSTEGGCQSPR
jgi:hypothetical protein